jgi:hypothetical protein
MPAEEGATELPPPYRDFLDFLVEKAFESLLADHCSGRRSGR